MKDTWTKIKDTFRGSQEYGAEYSDDMADDYLELDPNAKAPAKAKVVVRPYLIKNVDDIKDPLDALREGYTIALINIKPLKDTDIIELKRAVNKLKKTCDAIEGDIAGFGDDWIVATPSFAKVHRDVEQKEVNDKV